MLVFFERPCSQSSTVYFVVVMTVKRHKKRIQNVVNNNFARKGFCDYENVYFCHLVERPNSTREALMNTVFVEFFRWAQRQLQSAMGTQARVIRDRKFSLVLKRLKKSLKNMTLNMLQVRIHTGFHRFTKICQSCNKEINFS